MRQFLLLLIVLCLAPGQAAAESTPLSRWQQGIALSAERILTQDYQELRIEQSVTIDAPLAEVWQVLSDLHQYPSFYSLFQQLDIHQQYYRQDEMVSEFTARRERRAGHFVIEDLYFGVLHAHADSHLLSLDVWQLDEAFFRIRLQLHTEQGLTRLAIVTTIFASQTGLDLLAQRELERPLFRPSVLKSLLEEGIEASVCSETVRADHFCL